MSQQFPFLSKATRTGELGSVGRFGVRRLIGQGGMGFVFEAFDGNLERLFALKVIKPELAKRKENLERFIREAKTLASIRHRNVVTIFEVGMEQRYPFLAMEMLSGVTLAERLTKGPVENAEALRIIEEVCQGLHAAHKAGIIHRDIKPSNLWLDPSDNSVRILDFGLAFDRHLDASNEDLIAGTLHYLSPEQAAGDPVTSRSDLYAVGVTLYQLLVRDLPHNEATSAMQLAAIATQTPKPLQSIDGALPTKLCKLVNQLLEKSPQRRPASAGEVASQLAAIRQDMLSGGARRRAVNLQQSSADRTLARKSARRQRKLAWLISSIVAGALMVGLGLWLASQPVDDVGTNSKTSTKEKVDSEQVNAPAGPLKLIVRPMLLPPPNRNAISNYDIPPDKVRHDLILRNRPGRSREQSLPLIRFEIDPNAFDTAACTSAELRLQPRTRDGSGKLPKVNVLTVSRSISYEQLAKKSWREWQTLRGGVEVEVLGVIQATTVSVESPWVQFTSPSLLRALREVGRSPGDRDMILLLEQVDRSQIVSSILAEPRYPDQQPLLTNNLFQHSTKPHCQSIGFLLQKTVTFLCTLQSSFHQCLGHG
ncbi:MAG: serine/threonine-protein kinase, partial [Planctomycetota bacterium]